MLRKLTVLTTVLALLCTACNSNSGSFDNAVALDKKTDQTLTADTVATPQLRQNQTEQKIDNTQKQIHWDKKIVKNASLNTEIKDYKKFSQQVEEKVRKYGGYISQEEQNQSNYKIENSVVIKVPVDQFENAVNDLTGDVVKLNEKKITSEDVTTELVDGKARLEAKKQVRLRYLDLLKQAKNMQEILNVQKEINDIQEDIESVSGRIEFLSHSSAMSTINFTYFQILDVSASNPQDVGFLEKVKSAFANGWHWVGELFVGIISIWPLMIVIGFAIAYFRKKQIFKLK